MELFHVGFDFGIGECVDDLAVLNNVEAISIPQPVTGDYTITINATRIGSGLRQGYALVVTGDVTDALPGRSRSVRRR